MAAPRSVPSATEATMGKAPIRDFQLIQDYAVGRGEPEGLLRLHMDVRLSGDDYVAIERLLAAMDYVGLYDRLAASFAADPRWEGALATLRAALTTHSR